MLVDALGRPRYWTSYSLARNGSSWADSTKFEYLSAIERFYLFVEARTGADSLDEILICTRSCVAGAAGIPRRRLFHRPGAAIQR